MHIIRTFTLKNELGLHARAAVMLVNVVKRFEAEVFFERDGNVVDGRSILGILTLDCPKGGAITVTAEGTDAENVVDELGKLIEEKFGEE
ncbi:MAG: phosphocarrier protein HPr [delta proteobacterium MLS_D]|jgi:phosphocarrier protein HPr|nr:MAG: phosphocarrier protein HPr [delta proteobacterium MLS_D]